VNAACPKVSNCWRVLGIIVLFVRGNYRESSSNGVERINRSFLSAKDIVRCRAAVAGNRSQTIMTAVEARVRQTLARKRKGAKPRLTRCRMRHIFSGRMLVNNSSRSWLEYTLDINRTPLPSTSDEDDWGRRRIWRGKSGRCLLDQSAHRYGVATGQHARSFIFMRARCRTTRRSVSLVRYAQVDADGALAPHIVYTLQSRGW